MNIIKYKNMEDKNCQLTACEKQKTITKTKKNDKFKTLTNNTINIYRISIDNICK